MATKLKTSKPSAEVKRTAEQILLRLIDRHSDSILNARDGEVNRKLVKETFDISVAFHAHGVSGERV